MANSFDFELKADDQVSASIQRIDEAVKNLLPNLTKTQDGLKLGGQESLDGLDKLNFSFKNMAKNARDGVQFIGDLVPPLKMVAGLTVGLGGIAKVINTVKNSVVEFAGSGYRIETTAKNIGMATRAFQELTGAMVENGAERDKAESSITDLFSRANNAIQGLDPQFEGLLQSKGIGLYYNDQGVVDMNRLLDDMHKKLVQMTPALQAVFGDKTGLSPEMLNYLRQSTDQIQRLKEQAQRDGLIFSDQDIQNALAFRDDINQVGAAWDGMLMKSQSWLGQSDLIRNSLDEIKQLMVNGPDNVAIGSILTWNNGGKQADILRKAEGDENFKKTLSFKEKTDLYLGYASKELLDKIDSYYGPIWQAQQLYSDVQKLYVQPPSYNSQSNGNVQGTTLFPQLEKKFQLPPGILNRVYQAESSGGKHLYSSAGAEGPFQFMPDTGRDYGLNSRDDRMDFGKSSEAAAKYLSDLLRMFDGDVAKAVAAYNWGPMRVRVHGLYHAPKETRDYLNRIMPGLPSYSPVSPQMSPEDSNPIVAPPYRINSEQLVTNASSSAQDIANAIAMAMKDSKTQIELTITNGQTGEKRIINTEGSKISTSMSYQ
ncbi:transglycosylase SLT domain-containing protein [Martelella alba]|uniref:Lytic transglycosylase domain-containing protein n=1 Tax=Martelella alba TaxID=2590451 RepID=A0ABY2SFP8_9HYPH|nr:transglycosylase SLT domain-containing protein [Martelella alba]TKI02898.1 lytic transglycosylase domain-containing protein [Martelella alba]